MARPKHSNKHIEAAVAYAEERGWRYVEPGGSSHIWGRLLCEQADRDGCRVSVFSTPRVPEHHARKLKKVVDTCSHDQEDVGGQDDCS